MDTNNLTKLLGELGFVVTKKENLTKSVSMVDGSMVNVNCEVNLVSCMSFYDYYAYV